MFVMNGKIITQFRIKFILILIYFMLHGMTWSGNLHDARRSTFSLSIFYIHGTADQCKHKQTNS